MPTRQGATATRLEYHISIYGLRGFLFTPRPKPA